ncbi:MULTISPECIES: response regulator [unclassified Rhodococcus (in: high G+C Gram-positive bacteria)]|uniref:response regulator n=1 Tax=unclassified Rhodococcus (in: high G+C Gram-positive bacteria) TaxID=192944 RepID=UPI0015956D16|nr:MULTISPECIES: response regulator [unclassified Rhodococcus (in: high G+C Gram-positive bacteria)]
MNSPQPDGSSAQLDELFPGDNATDARFRELDWAATDLGPVESWPQELVTAVRTVMPSTIPMLIWWGPHLVQIFNHTYTDFLGDKFPQAAGQRASESWSEIWDDVGGLCTHVVEDRKPVHGVRQLFVMNRFGYPEETYWTFSYSPIFGAGRTVLGVFVATTEVTMQVLGERRMHALLALGSLTGDGTEGPVGICRAAVETLGDEAREFPLVAAYLRRDLAEDGQLDHIATSGALGCDDATWDLAHVLDVCDGRVPCWTVEIAGSVAQAVIVPLTLAGHAQPIGALLVGVDEFRARDDSVVSFSIAVAERVSTALTASHAFEMERRRVAALAEADEAKTRLLENVGHEFRTPLTLLAGPLDSVRESVDSTLTDVDRESLDVVHRASTRLRRLVDDLLDVVSADAGQLRPRLEPTDLGAVTRDCASLFEAVASGKGLELVVDVADDVVVLTDGEMWTKIVFNLVANAVKYTPVGRISVRLRTDSDVVRLVVADTGLGIPAEDLPLIFDRFHRVERSGAHSIEGSGIGLALVSDLLTVLRGRIDVESEAGRGSTFTVVVPRLPAEAAAAVDLPAAPADSVSAIFAASDSAALTTERADILLVEDNVDMRNYLVRLLTDEGWSVTTAGDIETALDSARSTMPGLVLSDVLLPGRSGLELVDEIRRDDALQRVPVILLTARAGTDFVLDGLGRGADDYIVKPFHDRELVARIRVHLELSRVREQLIQESGNEAATLRTALDTRGSIGRAVGILMSVYRIDADAAFAQLTELSQNTNRKTRDLAAMIADDFTAGLDRERQ